MRLCAKHHACQPVHNRYQSTLVMAQHLGNAVRGAGRLVVEATARVVASICKTTRRTMALAALDDTARSTIGARAQAIEDVTDAPPAFRSIVDELDAGVKATIWRHGELPPAELALGHGVGARFKDCKKLARDRIHHDPFSPFEPAPIVGGNTSVCVSESLKVSIAPCRPEVGG